MIKKIFLIKIVMSFLINVIFADNSRINGLEKRIEYLENKVEELEQKTSNYSPNLLWENLTKGVSKSKIQSSFGNPDRKGKFSNGDELKLRIYFLATANQSLYGGSESTRLEGFRIRT